MAEGIHVVKKGEIWAVTRGNYTLDEFKSQQQAVQLAKLRARTTRSNVVVHADDGTVRLIEHAASAQADRKKKRTA